MALTTRTADITTAYTLSGKEGGEVVMLSHSLGSSRVMWEPQIEALGEDCRVLAYDVRGHGESEAPGGDYALEQLALDAVALMDALDVERVHWVGLSMGGMIGQALALRHADRLRSLALCDTMAMLDPAMQPVWQARIEQARNEGMASLWPPTAERWFTEAYRARGAAGIELIREQFEKTPVAGYVGCSQAIRRLDYLERLTGVRVPTCIVVGEQDTGTPVTASRAMHERLPGSTLHIIPEAAHLSNIEQPERFNSIVLEHLAASRRG